MTIPSLTPFYGIHGYSKMFPELIEELLKGEVSLEWSHRGAPPVVVLYDHTPYMMFISNISEDLTTEQAVYLCMIYPEFDVLWKPPTEEKE